MFRFNIDLPEDYQYLEVVESYPTQSELPANLLKMYVRFNRPISVGNIYDKIELKNGAGDFVERAFLPLENPLINEDGTLLTVWIEPGRQKKKTRTS